MITPRTTAGATPPSIHSARFEIASGLPKSTHWVSIWASCTEVEIRMIPAAKSTVKTMPIAASERTLGRLASASMLIAATRPTAAAPASITGPSIEPESRNATTIPKSATCESASAIKLMRRKYKKTPSSASGIAASTEASMARHIHAPQDQGSISKSYTTPSPVFEHPARPQKQRHPEETTRAQHHRRPRRHALPQKTCKRPHRPRHHAEQRAQDQDHGQTF